MEKKAGPTIDQAMTFVKNAIKNNRGNVDWDAPHPREIAEMLGRRFGGSEAFADLWFQQVENACENSPGKKATLDAIKQIYEMFSAAYASRETAPEVASMTADQLEAEMLGYAIRRMSEDPELFRKLATELGWELVPLRKTIEGELSESV